MKATQEAKQFNLSTYLSMYNFFVLTLKVCAAQSNGNHSAQFFCFYIINNCKWKLFDKFEYRMSFESRSREYRQTQKNIPPNLSLSLSHPLLSLRQRCTLTLYDTESRRSICLLRTPYKQSQLHTQNVLFSFFNSPMPSVALILF